MASFFADDLRALDAVVVPSGFSAGRGVMGRKGTVAVVDDDLSYREAMAALISAFGFEVRTYESAAAFLSDPGTSALQCLILDIRMPVMTGLDLQRRLAAQGRRTPIIFLTAELDDRTHARALNDGALAVLEKPCDEAVLLKHIKLALKIRD